MGLLGGGDHVGAEGLPYSDPVDYALRLWGDVGTVGGEGRRVGQCVLPLLDRQITYAVGHMWRRRGALADTTAAAAQVASLDAQSPQSRK